MTGLPAAFHLEGPRGAVVARWLRDGLDRGILFGGDLIEALGGAGLGFAVFPSDVDRVLEAFESEGLIRRVKWCPSFSRRAFLGLEGSGAANGSAYTYACDHSWEAVSEKALRDLLRPPEVPPPPPKTRRAAVLDLIRKA